MMTRTGGMALALALSATGAAADPVPAGPAATALAAQPVAKTVKVGERPLYPEFTFKRIGVPRPGEKRITVQVDPLEQKLMLAAVMPAPENPIPRGGTASGIGPAPGAAPAAAGAYSWFWGLVSPKLADVDGRFPLAVAAVNQGPGGSRVAAPRMQAMQDIAAMHGREILSATVGTQVSPALVLAVISVESGGRKDAVSTAGAVGLMQLIPATADRFDVADSTDAGQNIKGGVAYLDWLMGEFDGDPLMVIAAYNAGENAVKGAGGVPDYTETRDYVPKVLAAWAVARGLCVTPPELVTDGCVFAVNG
ncbi:MAG: lytic transglycosylase domain-containing protein [Paracoccaceae bacterium]